MATKIKYGIHRNPLLNEKGEYTYQVRLEPSGTFKLDDFILKLEMKDKTLASQAERIFTLLRQELTNQLQDNMRFRINGIGSFQLKVGFKHQEGGRGRIGKTYFTNPEAITADAVEVTGLSFSQWLHHTPNIHGRNGTDQVHGTEMARRPGSRSRVANYPTEGRTHLLLHTERIGLSANQRPTSSSRAGH